MSDIGPQVDLVASPGDSDAIIHFIPNPMGRNQHPHCREYFTIFEGSTA